MAAQLRDEQAREAPISARENQGLISQRRRRQITLSENFIGATACNERAFLQRCQALVRRLATWSPVLIMYATALDLMARAERLMDATDVHVELDRVPAMLQFALDSHAVERSHVQYQSMERWLLGAFGLADAEPDGHFDNLF